MRPALRPWLKHGQICCKRIIELYTSPLHAGFAGSGSSTVRCVSVAARSSKVPHCPEEPGPEDCCQSGCENCVWDVYRQELKQYTIYMAQNHPHAYIPARKAVKQQIVDASMDAFEQLERQLQMQAQQRQQQQQAEQSKESDDTKEAVPSDVQQAGNYVF